MKSVSEKLLTFFSTHTQQTFARGHIILPAFSNPPGIYYLVKGKVKQYSMTPDGREFLVNIFKPGTYFPLIPAMTTKANSFFFETLEEVEVYRAPVAETITFIRQDPEILYELLQRVYSGIDGLVNLISQALTGTVRSKVIAALLMIANRFGVRKGKRVELKQSFTHNDIAMIMGISRESVTRVFSEIKAQQLLEVHRHHISFPDIERLEQELL